MTEMDPFVSKLVADLQASGLHDVAGARASLHVPVSRALINQAVSEALRGSTAPVRSVDVQPAPGDHFDVVVALTWPFVPPLKVALDVEQQPRFPDAPVLVLRWSLLGAAGALASRVVNAFGKLPPGIRLETNHLVLDIPVLAGGGPAASVLPHVRRLELHTTDDRAVLDVELAID